MKDCYSASLNLLIRRDYSRFKIKQKLEDKGYSLDDIEAAISKLEGQNYLNEKNYLEGRIRHYARNKKGPLYILKKCEEEKLPITEDLIYQTYHDLNLDIDEMIQYHIHKKLDFNRINIQELSSQEFFKLYSRLSRHLLSKGYIVKNIEQYLDRESNHEG